MKIVDARGLACPGPVIQTKKALAEADQVTVIVDNQTASENVQRMIQSKGCAVTVQKKRGFQHVQYRQSPAGRKVVAV